MGQRGLVTVFVADVVCNTLTPLSVEGLGDGRYTGAPDIIILLLKQCKTQAEPLSSPIPRGKTCLPSRPMSPCNTTARKSWK